MDPTTDSSSTDEEQDDDFQSYFGRVEDLEVYQRDREYFLSTMTELVTCSICRMVIGAPDVIERHERSHSEAIVELPDYDHIYRSMIEDREKEERDALLAEKKRKSESWKELFGEILPKDRSPGEHSDFEIVVEIDGKSHDLERFEVFLMDELRRLLGKKGATTSSATRANDSRLPVNLYKRWCPHPRCRKGFVKEELYRMHLRRFHNQLEEDTPANSGENLA